MAEQQPKELKLEGAESLQHDPETTPPAQDASKQITTENVTKLNTTNNIADQRDHALSSPGGLISEPSDTFPVRGSSSAFLASLTSASDASSPLTSAFPSTDSLQSSELVQGDDDGVFGSLQRGSMIEMAMPTTSPRSVPAAQKEPTPIELLPQAIAEPTEPHTETSSPTEHYHKTPTNHDRVLHDLETKTPSRTHTPSHSAISTPGEHTRTDSQIAGHEFYSSGKHDEEYEQSHSKTPLLHPSDYPAPKETIQAVKDYSIMGNKLINQYETIQKLGSGAHGTVKLGRDLDNDKYVAIKIVRRYPKKPRLGKQQQSPEEKVKKEIAVLKKAQHPHVVSLLEVIDDQSIEKVYLVLEYVERGEIKWRKKTEREIANFELQRMKREIAGNVDEAAETEHLLNFNDFLHQQYLERAQNKSVTNSSASEGYHDEHVWEERSRHPIQSRHSSRPSSRPTSRPPSELDISATHTLRVPSRASSQRDTFSYENELNGSMYGSYVEDESIAYASVFERERWLKDEPTVDQQWTPEEEEYRFVPCLTLSEARDVFRDTVLGLEYLHYHNIIHRDIKPANLLWTKDYRVKISDFGVSYLGRPLEDEEGDHSQKTGADVSIELAKTVGTPAFYAPELCDPDLFDPDKNVVRPHISGQIDVWALGITLYAMVYGRLPFFDQNEFSMYEKIARLDVVVPSKRLRGVDFEPDTIVTNSNKREEHVLMYEDVDDELRDLIRRLLIKDPGKRITIKEVKHHPWLLRGMDDPALWIRVTDPAWKGDRIEVSQADLQKAVVPRTLLGKVWETMTNITKGRVPSRRRAETSSKQSIKRVSSSLSRSNTLNRDHRRESLKADESSILNVLRATRDLDHPLSKSTVATPRDERREDFFPPVQQVDSQGNPVRPSARTVTTADSILTVKAHPREEFEAFGLNRHVPGSDSVGSSSSSLAKILDNTKEATRRFASRVRSRDSQSNRSDDAGIASRTASGDNIALTPEGRSLKPSLAVSTALAAGHVELPASLHPESLTSSPHISPPVSSGNPSTDSLQSFERGRSARKRASTASNASWGYISPGLEGTHQPRLSSLASPSGHQKLGKPQFLPLTSASPWSQLKPFAEAMHSTPAYAATSDAGASLLTTGETITPEMMKQKQEDREARRKLVSEQKQPREELFHQHHQDNHKLTSEVKTKTDHEHDHDDDDGSDDEGITFGSKK